MRCVESKCILLHQIAHLYLLYEHVGNCRGAALYISSNAGAGFFVRSVGGEQLDVVLVVG